MNAALAFDPALSPLLLFLAGAVALLLVVYAALARSPAWALRALGFGALFLALANPSLVREARRGLTDIAFIVVDESESQSIGERSAQAAEAETAALAAIEALNARDPENPVEPRVVRVRNEGGPVGDPGTRLLSALTAAAAEVPQDRIAGALLVTDGQAHDADLLESFPGPVNALLTGARGEFDRRLHVSAAPAFGIVGEDVTFRFRVEDFGPEARLAALPAARVSITVDGAPAGETALAPGREGSLTIPITHGGANIVELALEVAEGEATDRNNRAAFTVNGVRDRLRVLLVSGEPHSGERTWRNLLKADPSVDLVHFTILRPPTKQDGTPVFELSLIAFPTRELFLEKVDEFDLIIFDRYRRRGVLPSPYIANIARYVRDGGAVLIAAGPWFAGVESLYRTPLAEILPVAPTGGLIEAPYLPTVTEPGARHPVTAGLDLFNGGAPGAPVWGRWMRQIEMERLSGEVVMAGADERPLLVLDRVGEGRVAVLGSDHAWLWSRGYEGGGPQAELLRRLAHWLMKEPELEEEALSAVAEGARLTVARRSVKESPERLEIVAPSGARSVVPFEAAGPGLWRAVFEAEEQGLHLLSDGALSSIAAIGPPAPVEFERAVASAEPLAALLTATRGGAHWLEDGPPDIRRVGEGRAASGRGWAGLARREAYAVEDVRLTPLAPGWLMLLLSAGLMVAAWRVEGR